MVRVCALNGIGFVVVPIRILQAQIWMGVIAGGHHMGEMRPGALVGMLGVLIFDKRAFAVEMFIFGAFFSNQVRFAWLKVGRTDKLKRSHVYLDAYYIHLIHFVQFFMNCLNFSRMMDSNLQKVWVNDAPWQQSMHYVDNFWVFDS